MLRRAERTRDKIDHPHHERLVVNMILTHGRSEQNRANSAKIRDSGYQYESPGMAWRAAARTRLAHDPEGRGAGAAVVAVFLASAP
jgi:hypothetical protein